MSNRVFNILYPIWIGIAFNFAVEFGQMLAMTIDRHADGWLASWWLDGNHFLLVMGTAWAVFITWSITNGLRFSRR